MLKENKGSCSEIAVLMSLLLFDEIASIETWLVYFASLGAIYTSTSYIEPWNIFSCCVIFSHQVSQIKHRYGPVSIFPATDSGTQVTPFMRH